MLSSRYVFWALIGPLCFYAAVPLQAAELEVEVAGLSEVGDVHCYVFTSADGFPKEERAAAHLVQALPAPGTASVSVHASVPDASAYAVMCFQDKDGDGKMNRLFGMIPQEPYGLSRNPKLFGKPKFEEAAISAANGERVRINLRD